MPPAKVTTYTNPTAREAGNAIVNARAGEKMVSLFAACEVDYDGRATSYLADGDREIQLKPDDTLLVHATQKHKPVNWQTAGANITVETADEDTLVIRGRTTSPEEHLTIYLSDIYLLVVYAARDPAELVLTGTEEEMHKRIMATPDLIEPGFRPLEHERAVKVGSIDVFGNDATGRPVIVEVKRRRAQLKDVDQLSRYVRLYRADADESSAPDVRGILVAPSASESVEAALSDRGLEFVSLKPAKNLDEASERVRLSDFEG